MRSKESELLYLYLFFDLIILNTCLWFGFHLETFRPLVEGNEWYYVIHGNVSWIFTFYLFPKRNLYLRDGFSNRFIRITRRTFYFITISLLIAFLTFRFDFSLKFFFLNVLALWLTKIVFYFGLYSYLKQARNKGRHTKNCVIVNHCKMAERLRLVIDCNPILGYRFMGYLSNKPDLPDGFLGKIEDFESLIAENRIEMVFILNQCGDTSGVEYKNLINLCHANGIRIRYVPDSGNWNRLGSNSETMMGIPLVDPLRVPLDSIWKRFWKRVFDIVFSILVFVFIFSWLFPIVALLIKLSSKGPILFSQTRTGLNNRGFSCYKFRSMRPNEESDLVQASANDDRITRIGKLMRATNIDELPQFWNVLTGKMSVVGPRPHMLAHTEMYAGLIDKYLQRHFVKPGITGWAQVNGLRGETNELWKMEKRVEFDMEYIRTWSMLLDLKIIFLTLFGKKAYNNAH